MRLMYKLLVGLIVFNLFNTQVAAQNDAYYHSFSGVMYIPIIVDHQEQMKFKDGKITERSNPEKKMTIQVNMNTKDMRITKGVFSGIILNNQGTVRDEVIIYKGKVSKDKQKLEYIEIKKEVTQYRLDTREDIEKTISLVARFENITKSPYGSGYKFKYGISKIASVAFTEDFSVPRSHYVNTYSEKFVRIDEDQMGKYYSGVRAEFKPTESKVRLKKDVKVTVIPEEKELIAIGVHALIVSDLMKIPGLIVLEGYRTDKILDEIKLSQSGLVSEETIIRSDRIMTPDIEIHLLAENRVPVDTNLPTQKVTLRSKIKIVKTGQVIDPSLTLNIDFEQLKKEKNFFEKTDKYIEEVIAFVSYFLFE